MKKLEIIGVILSLFLILPIWYYLLYKILEAIVATELMWFLYWIYVPAAIILTIIVKILESK